MDYTEGKLSPAQVPGWPWLILPLVFFSLKDLNILLPKMPGRQPTEGGLSNTLHAEELVMELGRNSSGPYGDKIEKTHEQRSASAAGMGASVLGGKRKILMI